MFIMFVKFLAACNVVSGIQTLINIKNTQRGLFCNSTVSKQSERAITEIVAFTLYLWMLSKTVTVFTSGWAAFDKTIILGLLLFSTFSSVALALLAIGIAILGLIIKIMSKKDPDWEIPIRIREYPSMYHVIKDTSQAIVTVTIAIQWIRAL